MRVAAALHRHRPTHKSHKFCSSQCRYNSVLASSLEMHLHFRSCTAVLPEKAFLKTAIRKSHVPHKNVPTISHRLLPKFMQRLEASKQTHWAVKESQNSGQMLSKIQERNSSGLSFSLLASRLCLGFFPRRYGKARDRRLQSLAAHAHRAHLALCTVSCVTSPSSTSNPNTGFQRSSLVLLFPATQKTS